MSIRNARATRRRFRPRSVLKRRPTRSSGPAHTRSVARSALSETTMSPSLPNCAGEKIRSERKRGSGMRRALIIIISIVVIVAGIGAAVIYTSTGRYLLLGAIGQIAKPHHGWNLAYKAPAPDYSKAESWAALPGHPSPANFVPEGLSAAVNAQVDVFFIHPTG